MQLSDRSRPWIYMGAIVLMVLVLLGYTAITGSHGTFTAEVTHAGVSPGGRWVLTVEVTNTGSDAGSPSCKFTAIDYDGVPLAGDSADLEITVQPGETRTTTVLTGLEPGTSPVRSWTADC